MKMRERNEKWTVLKLIRWSENYLGKMKFENPRLNVEWLLAHTLNIDRMQLYLNYDLPLNQTDLSTFKSYLKRRLKHEPVQYITGKTEFMSIPFKIDNRALIPRPETELLVEHVINFAKQIYKNGEEFRLLDIGTGSGNIPIAIKYYLPNAYIVSIDINKGSLDLATENAELNQLNDGIKFLYENVFSGTFVSKYHSSFEVIVSNPPYISVQDYNRLPEEIRNYEPAVALSDESDGLNFFRRVIEIAPDLLTRNGTIAFETGETQGQKVSKMLKNYGFHTNIFQDYNKVDRIVIGSLQKTMSDSLQLIT